MATKVSLIKCGSYGQAEVQSAVSKAVDAIGGIKAFVKPGMKILLKPNLLSARTPDRHVTTHPEIVRAAIRLVRDAGGIPVIGDSPGGAVKGVERVWTETGMKKLAEEENVKLVNFETSGTLEIQIDHPLIHSVHISKVPLEADGIINLPKLKTHGLMIFTAGVKNFYGTIPGLRKGEYHKLAPYPDDFGHLLSEIYHIVKPKVLFSLVDAVTAMEGNGPSSGDLRNLYFVAASSDTVALDICLMTLLGFKPSKLGTIKYLSKSHAGELDPSKIETVGDPKESFNVSGFNFPTNWRINLIPKAFIKLVGRFIWMKPFVVPELCVNCRLCVNSCPVKAIKDGPDGKPVVELEPCISCLCCHELCPHKAIELRGSFLARTVFRQ